MSGAARLDRSEPTMHTGTSFMQRDWVDVLRQGKGLYRLGELALIAGHSEAAARRAADRLIGRRWLARVGKGLYANMLRPEGPPTVEEVSAVLYAPAYVSLTSILFAEGVVEQAPHRLECVTTNKTKTFATGVGEVQYHRIKPALFFGYTLIDGVPRALPEKAVLDFVYLELRSGRRPALDEWNGEDLDSELLAAWASRYPSTVVSLLAELRMNVPLRGVPPSGAAAIGARGHRHRSPPR
jgi:predicted transcriptional regulator of viral defense system